jgi:hypothetical protein
MADKWPIASEDEDMGEEEEPSTTDLPNFAYWSNKPSTVFTTDLMAHIRKHGDDGMTWNATLDFLIDLTRSTEKVALMRGRYMRLFARCSTEAKLIEADYVELVNLSSEVAKLKADLAALTSEMVTEGPSSRKRPRGY